ncbi:sister chromatid cohesion protein DCC1 [Vespa velutina]|uniref:sister chromatid cohesion protein DCC1 n=1 Tax=Vespa velutina TaxID=202808 RepID=UPI001FB2FC76|nr:sister chromatid cohesion protein DCC1 [Vespa velutina]
MNESGYTNYLRNIEHVCETLRSADINESDLNETTQILYPAKDLFSGHGIKLVELDEQLLEIINKGDSLSFKGSSNETAVLCTENRTYEIKEAETSNSLLLVPDLMLGDDTKTPEEHGRVIKRCCVTGIFHNYYEVHKCKPRVDKILTVLEPSCYNGKEYESDIDSTILYDWDKLRNEIQASEDELKQALNDHLVVTIDGYLRLISFEAEVRNVTYMLDLFNDYSWEVDEVDKEITYDSLKELIAEPIFKALFEKYTSLSEKLKEDNTPLYRYNEEKVCKILAKVLLTALPVNKYNDFMESWKMGVPEKIVPKEEYLRGIAIIIYNKSIMQKEVISFPEETLPKNINDRLKEIFKVKEKWTLEEITPYILKFETNKLNVNALLTKYARCSTHTGIKYYSSKHGK